MFNRSTSGRRATVVAAACATFFASMWPTASRADEPQSVVITAARAPQPLTDAIAHTTLLTRTDIERSQAVDLAALLASEAGIQLASNGVRGTATSLFMRGAPTRQVLVLIDGVALARQDATGQVGIEHLMLDQVERIEIVRGNVSALYGSGAVGGVIQVFTRRGGAAQAAVQAELGARGFAQIAAQVSGGTGRSQWSLGVSGQRDQGLSALNPAQVPAANADRDGYRNLGATLNASHELATGHTLAFGWVHSDGRLAYDSAFGAPADVQDSRTRKDLLSLSSDNRITPTWTSRVRLSSQRDDARNHETGLYGYQDRYVTRAQGLSWVNELVLTPHTRWTAGIEQQQQRIDADDGFGGVYDHARAVTALFAGVSMQLGAHALALNLRRDRTGGVGARNSGRLGWGWQLESAWKLFASAGNAFSAPPLGYLYAPYFGNPALRPEVSRSAEAGLQFARAGQRLRATLFQTRVEDELEFDLGSYTFGNIARTRNRGLELSYAGRVGATDVRASLTAQRPVDDVTGARRLRRSDALASVSASHDLGQGWRIGLAGRYASARSDVGDARLAAYTVIDATTQWDVRPDLQWFARVENVGDARYQTALGYNQAPRGLFTGLRWRLAL